MAYTTYDYYLNTYRKDGAPAFINAREFSYYERLAEVFIKETTLGNSESYTSGSELQDCTCAIAEKYKAFATEDRYNKGSSQGITSEKVGEYSISYGGGISALEVESVKKSELNELLRFYLGITGLLFRGA